MKYSIMIMSHNNHQLLQDCIRSIERYTDFEYDLIIVDDASTPPYQDQNAIIVRMPRRSNCCNLRNVGMEMAKSEYVFWLDNDTMVQDGWYKPMLETITSDKTIGLSGSPKDSRLVRNPFLPLNQMDCMIEYQFAYDYNHKDRQCDFITSYCIVVRKDAFRPTHCYGMPTPVLDPDLGANVKISGYKVVVAPSDANVQHIGSLTPREGGTWYHYWLSRKFTEWFKFWEPHADKVFELYKGIDVSYHHDANEPMRYQSRNGHGDKDKDFEVLPPEAYVQF